MPDNKIKKIEMTDDGITKHEIVLKREPYDQNSAELDLVAVFKNMGKSKHIFVWLIILGMAIGLLLPYIKKQMENPVEQVSAIITLEFPEATDLKAPDGSNLDVGFIMSSHILQSALEKIRLDRNVSIGSVSSNMTVKRLLSEETRQQLEILEKLDEGKSTSNPGDFIESVNGIDYSYKNQYIISLSNGFGEGESTIYLNGDELSALLNSIVETYKDYFFKTYANFILPDNISEDIVLDELDYIEWLDNMDNIINSMIEYCSQESVGKYLDYRSAKDGMSFRDIESLLKTVKSVRLDYLYAYVYSSCLTKDKENLITKLNYKKRALELQLGNINEKIANGEKIIENYKNNNVVVSMFNGQQTEEDNDGLTAKNVTDYYNSLIIRQADLFGTKSAFEFQLKNLDDKIQGFSKEINTETHLEALENEIKSVNATVKEICGLIRTHAEEIVDSDLYANSLITSINAIYYSQGLLSAENIKNMLTGMLIGGVLAVLIWLMSGLIHELKRK